MPEKRPPDARDYFAAERTYLAWIRTGLALMGFGFVLARLALGNQLRSMGGNLLPDAQTRPATSASRWSWWAC